MSKHTATPWRVWHRDMSSGGPLITDRDGLVGIARAIYRMRDNMTFPTEASDNADFIVRAVNSHDQLVAALDELLGVISEHGLLAQSDARTQNARETLRAAGGD